MVTFKWIDFQKMSLYFCDQEKKTHIQATSISGRRKRIGKSNVNVP